MAYPDGSCPICKGALFVCENHHRLAWPYECDCGAGDPCPVCNVAEPPKMPDDFVPDEEADAESIKEMLEQFAARTKPPEK